MLATDSLQAKLYFMPVSRAGVRDGSRTLKISGPAADTGGELNSTAPSRPNGKPLIVAHSTTGQLYTVNPTSGATIAGVSLLQVDGIDLGPVG